MADAVFGFEHDDLTPLERHGSRHGEANDASANDGHVEVLELGHTS
jgi:hypothetical protein